jgi:hypothetical protein
LLVRGQRTPGHADEADMQGQPTEKVWQQLRDRSLANRCYYSYEQIVDVCCDAWNAFTQIPGVIRSLCTRAWANLDANGGML